MNPKTTRLWLLIAAGLLAFIVFYHRGRKHAPGPLRPLPELRAAAVTAVLVRTQGQGQIRAQLTNGTWRLTEPLGDIADGGAVDRLVQALEQLTAVTYIAPGEIHDPGKAGEEYGFVPERSSISIQQGEQKLPQLKVGRKTNPGDQVFLQAAGDAGVFVVDAGWLDLMPTNGNVWRDPSLVNLTNLAFDRLGVTNRGASFVLQWDARGLWRMVDPLPSRADNPRIQEGLFKLHSLRVKEFVPESAKPELEPLGLAPPELEIGLNLGPTNLALVQFGKTNETGQVYARRLGRNAILTVPTEMIAQWWRATPNDFRDRHLLPLAGSVEAIEIRGEDTFSVQRRTNDSWRILPQNFPADAGLVGEMLSNLTNMPIAVFKEDVVTEPLLPKYGLAAPRRRIRLFGPGYRADGTNGLLADVSFGTNNENQVYALRSDEAPYPHIYTINTNDFARLPAVSWQLRDRRLWTFSTNEISGVTIRHMGKMRQLARRAPYKWSPITQGDINPLAIEEIVRGLAEVEAVVWTARSKQNRGQYGFKEDGHQITLELKSGEKVSIEFGGQAPSGRQYACTTLDKDLWIFEFPPTLYRQVLGYLTIPENVP